MKESPGSIDKLRRSNPIFFWGALAVLMLLLSATAVVGFRIPQFRQEATELDRWMSETERATRDRILSSQARRSELAIGLLQRELRLKALEESGLHLAVSTEDSLLMLRHGPATLREVRIEIGPDSTIRAADGRSWRLVRALGERHLMEKVVDATYTIPEWVFVAREEAVPEEADRRIAGGLGRYLLRLDDGTEIYTRPRNGPFSEGGAKPGAIMVENEGDMSAIFEALRLDAPVYIY
jgi:hypothetical protein